MAGHVEALRAILGDLGVVTEAVDLAAYGTGARYDVGQPAFVLRPATTDAVSDAVSYCVRHELALVPQSGNTGLVSGSTPDMTGRQVVLSLDRLTGVFALDRVNRSLTVGAGLRLSEVNRRLEDDGLQFPIDLGADPRIGGMLATNTGGSRFLKFGDVRRNTLGLTVVLADEAGTVLHLGGGLRKNNTGIDWKQLFIGTSGALGVVTECVLNVEPLPRQVATAFLVPRDPDAVPGILLALEQYLGTYLSAFEGMSRNAVAAALDHVPSLRNPFQGGHVPDYLILVEISRSWEPRDGEQTLDAALEEVLALLWEQADAPLADAFIGPPAEMWALRHALSEGVKHAGQLIAFDVSVARGDIMRFCQQMKATLETDHPDVKVCDFGHIGDGGVHFNLVIGRQSPHFRDAAYERTLRDLIYAVVVEDFDGSFSAEHAIGRKNQIYYDAYTPDTIKGMAAGLKTLLSPGQIGVARFGPAADPVAAESKE